MTLFRDLFQVKVCKRRKPAWSVLRFLFCVSAALPSFAKADGQVADTAGPYLAHLIAGGPALVKPLPETLASSHTWTQWLWFRTSDDAGERLIAGVGDPTSADARYFELRGGRPGFWLSSAASSVASDPLARKTWHMLAATDDGKAVVFYVDGSASFSMPSVAGNIVCDLRIAPDPMPPATERFSGDVGGFSVAARVLSAKEIADLYASPPDFDAQLREENAKPWPLQTKQQVGYQAPQDPSEMPHGATPEKPVAKPLPAVRATLLAEGPDAWQLAANWRLYSNASHLLKSEDGARISKPDFDASKWLPATVPGTVLTTMVDRGVYPDPDFGLNNLVIPETLNQHDYWYRVEFPSPASRTPGAKFALHFDGINYLADVWLNGHPLGQIRGAFRRGDFDVTQALRSGVQGVQNVLAVRIAPPPHPGIPQEQSIKGGPGYDGGLMLIDGPTFVATEGWDWMPAIRDRDTGIWQGVRLVETGSVTLADAQVITRLPLPDTSSADVELNIPVHNATASVQHLVLSATFEGVSMRMLALVPPGDKILHLSPRNFSQLHILHPRLWWPNGYGDPNLYHLKLQVSVNGAVSDEQSTTFGIREVTYELTLFDHTGGMRRVEISPIETLGKGFDCVDVHHADMRQTATGWASTIDPKAEDTAAVRAIPNPEGLTDLVIRVNGVRIAVRGGNWGMDDTRKRVSRERLEPYFRLHREANLNMIRNWVGQNTEETFYELADKYGMMVWNDFWMSTQNYNAEPGDPALLLDNARDTVRRYRNHPSIVVWCGRNEGVPPPVINDMLIDMLRKEDGTRFYSPSSNMVNLRPSGPYHWVDPSLYFSELNRGFSMELGISSFPTREAFEHTVAEPDRWPMSDAWAYHDWHQSEGGDTHELMRKLADQLGPSHSLDEFERRIQLFNYVDHQAIYEGMYAHLWKPNSGRMIWMTQPAWPSTMWQMYSSDYDTQASFYGIKKANSPIHIQMDRSDGTVAVVNTTRSVRSSLRAIATVISYRAEPVANQTATVSAAADATTPAFQLSLASLLEKHRLLFVRLELKDVDGSRVADNFYWLAPNDEGYRALEMLAPASIAADLSACTQSSSARSAERQWKVRLRNTGRDTAIALKLTLFHADGSRVLPAYYSDNYVSLLPAEERTITVSSPEPGFLSETHFTLRGWNLTERPLLQTMTDVTKNLSLSCRDSSRAGTKRKEQ